MENADAYCKMVLYADMHGGKLNQVNAAGIADFLAIRKNIGYAVPDGQPLYNTREFNGYTMGIAGEQE